MSSSGNSVELFERVKEDIPERQGRFLGEEKDRFYIALSPEEVYELSPLAYYVWLLCDGEHSVGDLATKMSSDLGLGVEEVIEPLMIALNGLTSVSLVVIKKKTSV